MLDFNYGFNFGIANNGNVASIANNRAPGRSQTFEYDELNRIQSAVSQATSGPDCWGQLFGHVDTGNYVSGYDIWANLREITPDPWRPGCPVGTLGVLPNTKNQIGDSGFFYDASGNLTNTPNPGGLTMVYDAENRMTSTAGVTYTHDGDGKRVAKSNGKLYWYGMSADALVETDASGNNPTEYIFFGGKRIARRDSSGTVFYYFGDHLGTSRSIVQAGQSSPCYDADYYPFGGERVVTDTCPQAYKFTGKERDSESNLDFFIARYYSSNFGRFLSPDEFTGGPVDAFSSSDPLPTSSLPYALITNPQSLNKYTYTWNNPLRYTDPDGHFIDTLIDIASAVYSASAVVADVITGSDQLKTDLKALGGDLVAVAVPGLTGVGSAIRAANKVDNVVDTVRAVDKGVDAMQRGKQAEKAVLQSENLAKNTKVIQAVDPKTGKAGGTIPDAIRPDGQTVDVKDVKRLSDSPQLRRQSEISAQSGQKAEIIVTNRNQTVSSTVKNRMAVKKSRPDDPTNP